MFRIFNLAVAYTLSRRNTILHTRFRYSFLYVMVPPPYEFLLYKKVQVIKVLSISRVFFQMGEGYAAIQKEEELPVVGVVEV